MPLNPLTHTNIRYVYSSGGYTSGFVAATEPGKLISLQGYSNRDQFIQVFDLTSVPANGSRPVLVKQASGNFQFEFPIAGFQFLSGVIVANSTTSPTLTIGVADTFYTAVIAK